jgi:hypothetical protein
MELIVILIGYSLFAYIYYGGMIYADTEDGEELMLDYQSILFIAFAPVTLPFILGYLTCKNN